MQVLLLCHQINTLCKWKGSNKEENQSAYIQNKRKKKTDKHNTRTLKTTDKDRECVCPIKSKSHHRNYCQ